MLKLGIIGTGPSAAQLHLPALRRIPSIEITAVSDSDIDKARDWNYPVKQVWELLEDPAIEAVAILTPPSTHASILSNAILRGKHIFIEKPLADSELEIREMLRMALRSKGKIVVGHNNRCHRLALAARERIRSSRLGTIRAITMHWTGPAEGPEDPALLEVGVHQLDLVSWLCDSRIEATSVERSGPTSCVQGRLQNGVLFHCFWSKALALQDEVQIHGSAGTLRFSLTSSQKAEVWGVGGSIKTKLQDALVFGQQLQQMARAVQAGGDWKDSYRTQWQNFYESVKNNTPVTCSVGDAAEAALRCLAL
jgi:predicted dehydrogenase